MLQQEGSWKKLSALASLSLQPSGRVSEQFQLFRHNVRVEDFLWFLDEARREHLVHSSVDARAEIVGRSAQQDDARLRGVLGRVGGGGALDVW